MSNNATPERPTAPRPVFETLPAAARCAVAQPDYKRSDIVLARWAVTYRCAPEDVSQALDIAENGSRRLPEEIAVHAPPATTQEEVEE